MLKRVASELTSLMTAGAVRPHIGTRFAFNQLPQALSSLAERRSTGKVLLIGTDEEMES